MRHFYLLYLLSVITISSCNRTKTVKPVYKDITEAVYASGFVVPRNEYKVYSLADGFITDKLKDGGDTVAKGDIIYRIQSDVAVARAGASSAVFQESLRNASESSPLLIDLQNKVKSAQAKMRNDSMNYTRYKSMFDAKAVTKAQLDQASLAFEIATNEYNSAKENYQRTKSQLSVEVKNAQSVLASSQQDVSNFTIKSLMNGVVYETYKDLGEAVRRNDVVALIGEGGNMILELSVDQSDISRVSVGQEVVVKLDVTADKIYKATITRIYPTMNQSDQSFKVEAVFYDEYPLNLIHASVEANIIINRKSKALVLPRSVFLANNEVEVRKTGVNEIVKVKTGLSNLEFVEITKGLTTEDEVILPSE